MRRLAGGALAAVMISGLVLVLGAGYALVQSMTRDLGQAPGFELQSTGFEGGTHGEAVNFTLEDYHGKTLVLDFMAVTCATCRIVTKDVLKPLDAEFGNRTDFAILSVDVWAGQPLALGETKEELVKLQQEEATSWRHALDSDDMLQKYGAIGIPLLTVIDAQGRIVYQNADFPEHANVRAAVQSALAGTGDTVPIVQTGLLGLSFLAGLAAILSPCSVGLLPAYVGRLASGSTEKESVPRENRPLAPIVQGLAAAAGVIFVYAGLAIALWAAGPVLRNNLEWAGILVATAMVAIGAATLFGLSWSRFIPQSLHRFKPRGQVGFGVAYGAAAFGCTGPIFVPLMALAFLDGAILGVSAFTAYAFGVAVVLVLVAALVATGNAAGMGRILPRASVVSKVAAGLMVLAGFYLFWFYGRAGILPWQ